MSKVQKAIDALRDLPRGWDSYDAATIDYRAINTAKVVADALTGEWSVVPGCDGSVQLEQHMLGVDIEIRIAVSTDGA